MSAKVLLSSLAVGAALLPALPAQAVTLYDDLAAWTVAVEMYQGTTVVPGTDFEVPSSITLSGGSVLDDFSGDVERRTVGETWGTWPGQPGSNGTTVYFHTGTEVSFDFTGGVVLESGNPLPVDSFGFFIEPNNFGFRFVTVELETGESLTQLVNGDAGAKFFGWTGDGVTRVTISGPRGGFAFGQFYEGAVPIPEPETYALMLMGLAGLALMRRRRAH